MILNMIWHVVQDAVKCYFVPLSRRSYIYWPIYFNRTLDYHFLWEPVKFWWGSMFLFFEVFQPQNLFILFLFFLKHSYQTLSKIKHLKYSPVKKKKKIFQLSDVYSTIYFRLGKTLIFRNSPVVFLNCTHMSVDIPPVILLRQFLVLAGLIIFLYMCFLGF